MVHITEALVKTFLTSLKQELEKYVTQKSIKK